MTGLTCAAGRAAGLLLLLPALASARAPGDAPVGPAPLPAVAPLEPTATPPLAPSAPEPAPAREVPPRLMERPDGWILDAWLDVPHAFLEHRIFGVVAGFDRFFADERDLSCPRPNSFLRYRSELRLQRDGSLHFGNSLRADLSLPYIRKRLKRLQIVIENAGRGLVDSGPGASQTGTEPGARSDAILRLTLLESIRSSFDLGGGVLLTLPPGLVGRVRWRYARELGRVALARFVATGFWNTKDHFGTGGSIALERALPHQLLLRWTTGTTVTQVSSGFESASELALLAPLGRDAALTVLGAVASHSRPQLEIQTWRLATRLRASLYRRWIFGEVEPEVTWPLDPAGGRRPVPALIFRVEVQFEDSARNAGVAAGVRCGLASTEDSPKGGA